MSTMNSKRNRGGRMNSGNRNDKRQIYPQDRQQRNRGQVNEKNLHIDGIYKNQRLTHVVHSMVGSVVQVQVKNGLVYEGILRTCSPNVDIVLDYAHMVEENGNGGPIQSNTPSKDRIITKIIVKLFDLVSLTAASLDLDYAVKDSFTDAGISKYNGEIKEKEMRELQPWESEGGDEITLDGTGDKSSNGWDPNDMFHTNAVQFNVKSSYDDSLEQYTTKLDRGNSEEYRRREQQASKIAAEIERCDSYKKHIALENGDGDDEEAAFSAVVRPGESSSQSQPTGTGGPGKYIPPNKRAMGGGGVSKAGRGGYSAAQSNRNIPQQQSLSTTQVSSQSTVDNINGEETGRPTLPVSTAGPTVKTSPVGHEHGSQIAADKQDHASHVNKVEGKKGLKGRDEQIKELKEFSSNFKLDDNKDPSKEKDKEKDKDRDHNTKDNKEKASLERKESVSEEKDSGSEKVVSESKDNSQPAVPVSSVSHQESSVSAEEKNIETNSTVSSEPIRSGTDPSQEKAANIVEKSTLNPNAKEFVFNPSKSFQPKQATQQQIPTPPRPQTQSPMSILNIQPQPVYPAPGQHFMMPPGPHAMVLNSSAAAAAAQPQYNVRPKRAVVSVKPDYTASAVQAATGQPLLAQSAQPGYMYIPHQMMPPQPTGYQMGQQVMPMPAANPSGQRFMTPTSVQGVQPSSMQHASGMEQQNNPALQASQVYMTTPNQGPMPAHMTHASHFTHPNHIIMSNPNSQQPQQNSQINHPPPSAASSHHHPAPSPVHTNPNQQSMNPGPHPPSSGTPQPPQGYPQATLQAHPPLQPSPHNPTSPQTMQQMHYPFNTSHGHHMQMQGSAGGQQFSVPQQSSVPTSVTYSMQAHTHQSPHMQTQIVMMPPTGPINNPHIHNSQFQGHPPGTVQPQLMSQSGVQGLPGQNPGQGPHPQMQHFIPQGLTAAALTSALHVRPEHFIVQHLRK